MRHHHAHGRRSGRPGGWQQADQPDASDAADWFAGRLPDDWFAGDPTVVVDREEITVIGRLPEPETPKRAKPAPPAGASAIPRGDPVRAHADRRRGRGPLRPQGRLGRRGRAAANRERILFTHIAVPVMTRLRQPERQVLDTLVDAGVARSRSDALAWSVKLVGEHADEWLGKLRDAMRNVDDLGPRARSSRADAFDADV